jgi:hypothetical protein
VLFLGAERLKSTAANMRKKAFQKVQLLCGRERFKKRTGVGGQVK